MSKYRKEWEPGGKREFDVWLDPPSMGTQGKPWKGSRRYRAQGSGVWADPLGAAGWAGFSGVLPVKDFPSRPELTFKGLGQGKGSPQQQMESAE